MTSQISMTLPLPAYGWQAAFAREAGFVRLAVNVAKRIRHHAQGCFSMTD